MPTTDVHRRLAALAREHFALTGLPLTWHSGAETWTVFCCENVLVHGAFEKVEAEIEDLLNSVREFWDDLGRAMERRRSE